MRGVCCFAIGKNGGFAALGVVVMLLLILAFVALLTRDLLQSELQNGQGKVHFVRLSSMQNPVWVRLWRYWRAATVSLLLALAWAMGSPGGLKPEAPVFRRS